MAGVSAVQGGKIFSGDFTAGLSPVISDALTAMYAQYEDSLGNDSGVVDYTATVLVNNPQCDGISKLWTEVKDEGVQPGVPFPTFDEVIQGTLSGGTDFNDNMTAAAADNVFTDAQAAVQQVPRPNTPSFSGISSSCDVMVRAGLAVGPCP
jgi:hypothetical protein